MRRTQDVAHDTELRARLAADVPAELHRAVKRRAIDEGRDVKDIVRDAVEQYLERAKAAEAKASA